MYSTDCVICRQREKNTRDTANSAKKRQPMSCTMLGIVMAMNDDGSTSVLNAELRQKTITNNQPWLNICSERSITCDLEFVR